MKLPREATSLVRARQLPRFLVSHSPTPSVAAAAAALIRSDSHTCALIHARILRDAGDVHARNNNGPRYRRIRVTTHDVTSVTERFCRNGCARDATQAREDTAVPRAAPFSLSHSHSLYFTLSSSPPLTLIPSRSHATRFSLSPVFWLTQAGRGPRTVRPCCFCGAAGRLCPHLHNTDYSPAHPPYAIGPSLSLLSREVIPSTRSRSIPSTLGARSVALGLSSRAAFGKLRRISGTVVRFSATAA